MLEMTMLIGDTRYTQNKKNETPDERTGMFRRPGTPNPY